jgi:hypothetical protein
VKERRKGESCLLPPFYGFSSLLPLEDDDEIHDSRAEKRTGSRRGPERESAGGSVARIQPVRSEGRGEPLGNHLKSQDSHHPSTSRLPALSRSLSLFLPLPPSSRQQTNHKSFLSAVLSVCPSSVSVLVFCHRGLSNPRGFFRPH